MLGFTKMTIGGCKGINIPGLARHSKRVEKQYSRFMKMQAARGGMVGAASGAIMGGVYGMESDNTSFLTGAAVGAAGGFFVGRGIGQTGAANFASKKLAAKNVSINKGIGGYQPTAGRTSGANFTRSSGTNTTVRSETIGGRAGTTSTLSRSDYDSMDAGTWKSAGPNQNVFDDTLSSPYTTNTGYSTPLTGNTGDFVSTSIAGRSTPITPTGAMNFGRNKGIGNPSLAPAQPGSGYPMTMEVPTGRKIAAPAEPSLGRVETRNPKTKEVSWQDVGPASNTQTMSPSAFDPNPAGGTSNWKSFADIGQKEADVQAFQNVQMFRRNMG